MTYTYKSQNRPAAVSGGLRQRANLHVCEISSPPGFAPQLGGASMNPDDSVAMADAFARALRPAPATLEFYRQLEAALAEWDAEDEALFGPKQEVR